MSFFRKLDGIDSSRQLAMGLALGAMIGLLPKDNALFVGLLVTLVISGANFITGCLSGIGFSLVGSSAQPLMHEIGKLLFQFDWVVGLLGKFFQLPIAPWTHLDNSVVAGSFVTGLAGFIPCYLVSFYLFESNRTFIRDRILQSSFVRWIIGYETPSHEAREN